MITKFAIKNNVLTISIMIILVFLGVSVFSSMPRDDMPPFLIRSMSIVTSFPGASSERVENLISDKIEKVVQEVPQVDFITSESRTGISIVRVNVKESEFDLRPIFDRIRRKVEDMEHQLPGGTNVTIKDELGDVFGIIIGLTADGYSFAEMKEIAEDIRDGLIKLPNAAKVKITGRQEEQIFMEFDDARLSDLGLTNQKLQGMIAATNIVFPGGNIKVGNRRIILEPTGSFESVEDLKNTIISSRGGEIVRLGDVTTISRGYIDPRETINKINGKPGMAIGVNLIAGGNIIELGREVDGKLEEFLQVYPHGVEIQRVASQDAAVDQSVKDFIDNLIQAVGVVLAVMLLFLGLRTGLVVASLIPVTVVTTLLLMSMFGVGLNKVSLASLIIALGMLVDNAIVMSESIMVKMEGGKTALDAAVDSSKELMVPLLTSSLTTAAAFMAFFLAESVMGEIMGQIFVVVSIALLSSWMLTLTMVALLCVYTIKVKTGDKKKADIFDKSAVYYRDLLVFCLKKPTILILVILALFTGSIYLMRFIPMNFMPKSDRAIVSANIELPLGTRIERTEEVVNDIETFIKENLATAADREKGIVNWSSYVGEGAPKYDLGYTAPEASPNAAHILMNTTGDDINDEVIRKLDLFIFENFPDVTRRVSRLLSGGGSADPVAVRVSGKDPEKLSRIVEGIKTKLASIPGSQNISDDWGAQSKKIMINIHPAKAQLAGLSNQDIAVSLQTLLSGAQTGQYREGDNVIPIIMRNEKARNLDIGDLESLNIFAQQSGKNVPLKQAADVEVVWEAPKIKRRDLYKTITVSSDLQEGYTASDVTNQLVPWLKKQRQGWGLGYKYHMGGDAESSGKAMGAVADKFVFSIFIIILLLIGQFNSIRKPAIILMTIPLGMIGVILGLLLTGSYFGFMGFLGIISLSGIVINNAIVLLDRIEIELTELGRTHWDAIVEAAGQRYRPILLTTFTTSLGLVPLWMGGGVMWEPMAISIIFGLLFATVLTLLFIPVMYKLFFKVRH
ncbi:MAG: efflux RND transporter permease subunit [bacterium]|nr:efflux RND transporter permease subunit [bacterium]